MNIVEAFRLMGLGSEYSKIYEVLLKEGNMRVIDIANKTRLPRTSCYEYLPKLVELNLVEEIVEDKSRLFAPKSPANILNILYKLKNDVNFTLGTFEAEFASLMNIFENNENRMVSVINDIDELDKILIKLTDAQSKSFGPENFDNIKVSKLKTSLNRLKKNTKYHVQEYKNILKVISNDKILFVNLENGNSLLINDTDFASLEKLLNK